MADREPISAQALVALRAGDPAAMAELCFRRGGSVLAFCTAACGPELAPRAAAEAFARLRAAVAAAEDPNDLDADQLLLGATRHAAASLAPVPAPGSEGRRLRGARRRGGEVHAVVPVLLAARAAGGLGAADQDRLARHLKRCSACRDIEARFAEAERHYATPDAGPPPPELVGALVTSMAAAVPVATAVGEPSPGEDAGFPDDPGSDGADEGHGLDPARLDEHESTDLRAETMVAAPAQDGSEARDDDGWTDEYELAQFEELHQDDDPELTAVHPAAAGVVAVGPDPELDHILDDRHDEEDGELEDDRAAPIAIRGHPEATAPATAAIGRRFGRPLAILLPLGVVVLGVAAAMAIAGVFGGDDTQPPKSELASPPPASVRAPVTTPLPSGNPRTARTPAKKRKKRTRRSAAVATTPAATATVPSTTPDASTTPRAATPVAPVQTQRVPTPDPTPAPRTTPAPTKTAPQSATKVPGGNGSSDPEPATQTTPTFQPAAPAP
jgi:hypothetical protein